jgi:filamentous hemagglutinin
VPDGASTAFSYSSKATSRSSTQIQMTISQSKAIANLEANGFAKSFSQDGTRTILQKGDQIYRFYPEATSTLEPSAKLSIEGIKKPTATLRFPAK